MSNRRRRFEILLPIRLNDGRSVPDDWFADAINELVTQFDAASVYNEVAEGYWQHGGTLYRDELGLIIVDVPDTAANRR